MSQLDSKPRGWYSRRNQSADSHTQAVIGYQSTRGIDSRREGAQYRQAERSKRTPEQQLERLDSMLGVGLGARRERARLQREMDELAAPLPENSRSKHPKQKRERRKKEKS